MDLISSRVFFVSLFICFVCFLFLSFFLTLLFRSVHRYTNSSFYVSACRTVQMGTNCGAARTTVSLIARHFQRQDSQFAPNQWETSLQSNAVSHWLGIHLESSLKIMLRSITSRHYRCRRVMAWGPDKIFRNPLGHGDRRLLKPNCPGWPLPPGHPTWQV